MRCEILGRDRHIGLNFGVTCVQMSEMINFQNVNVAKSPAVSTFSGWCVANNDLHNCQISCIASPM